MSDAPWFSVGEDVILNSREHPEYNGEYEVVEILNEGDLYTCRLTGKTVIKQTKSFSYLLNEVFKDPDRDLEMSCSQSTLRKKHKPSDESFETMMESLKTVSV